MIVPVCICTNTNARNCKENVLAAIKRNDRNKHGLKSEAREQSNKTEKQKEVK